jgi:acetylornithine/succinyldiaminopimelate/putrescine aminotransferase
MCGLARHGHGALFLSTALGLPVDAVVFGKSIAMGLPLAGAAVRPGAVRRVVPLESHTYAGAGRIAIRAATEAVAVLPRHAEGARAREAVVRSALANLPPGCAAHGQGLLWGVAHPGTREQMALACRRCGVWPYSVAGGVMVTPPLDADPVELHRALLALVDACHLMTAR